MVKDGRVATRLALKECRAHRRPLKKLGTLYGGVDSQTTLQHRHAGEAWLDVNPLRYFN
jgi:hypothetical protein